MVNISSYLYLLPKIDHLYQILAITVTVWITYAYTLRCGFVSDDHAGIAEYDGKLQSWEYGTLWRWIRYHACGGNFPSKVTQKLPDGKEISIPQGKLPIRHHFLSIVVFNITCIISYFALAPIIGWKVALLAILILIVHPCTTQGVAWISGLAYPLSLLWISITILLMQFFYAHQTLTNAVWVIPVFCLVQFLAIHAIFATTAMTWALLLFLGYWQFAILALGLSGAMCFDQIRKTVSFRVEEFKKQHMEQSTVLNWNKYVVAMKTFWYYVCHACFPMRMGLYHEWGFHYEKSIERRDLMFWKGALTFLAIVWLFINVNCLPVKLSLLWFVIFSMGFWNFITAQQFVTERYIMVANLGIGILIATLTQNYLWAYAFVFGMYLCKTLDFLPTYDNELRFYLSNTWNFSKSEVAFGNLGVTYTRIGCENAAKDIWAIATSLNSNYDVPWVNIFYQLRSQGFVLINNGDYFAGIKKLSESVQFVDKALQSKVCHFPEQWKKEREELITALSNPGIIFQQELARLLKLRDSLRSRMMKAKPEEVSGIELSIRNNEAQMEHLIKFVQDNKIQILDITPFNAYNATKLMDKLTRRM